MKKQFILIIILMSIVFSCNNNETIEQSSIDPKMYQQLRMQLKDGFSKFSEYNNGTTFRKSNENFSSEFWEYFDVNYDKDTYLKDNSRVFSELTDSQMNFLMELGYHLNLSESKEEFLSTLEDFYNQILNSDLSNEEKNFKLTYLVIFQESINYFEDITSNNVRVQGWWSSWGRCAAGIIGSGITGAATVGLAGAAAGATVGAAAAGVGAVPGAAVGGAIGAIAGGIGGALVGAATFCEEQELYSPNKGTIISKPSNFNPDQFLISRPTIKILPKIG